MSGSMDYRSAGVDIDAAEDAKERYRRLVESTRTAGAVGAFGSFGGLFRAPVGQSLARLAQADVDAEDFPHANRHVRRQLDAEAGGADVFRLPAEVAGGGRLEDLDRAVLADAQPAAALGAALLRCLKQLVLLIRRLH